MRPRGAATNDRAAYSRAHDDRNNDKREAPDRDGSNPDTETVADGNQDAARASTVSKT